MQGAHWQWVLRVNDRFYQWETSLRTYKAFLSNYLISRNKSNKNKCIFQMKMQNFNL
jgi:hypothetical protein